MLPHIDTIISQLNIRGWNGSGKTIQMSKSAFKNFLSSLALTQEFDEEFYLECYPDVKKALESGSVPSAKDHFLYFGVFEGRIPSKSSFNAEKYIELNRDVQSYIEGSENPSGKALEHYLNFGYKEWRFS